MLKRPNDRACQDKNFGMIEAGAAAATKVFFTAQVRLLFAGSNIDIIAYKKKYMQTFVFKPRPMRRREVSCEGNP